MDTDSKASWGESAPPPASGAASRPVGRSKPQRSPMGKGPVILVTAFAAVLLAVVIWPPKKAIAPISPTPSQSSEPVAVNTPTSSPVAVATPQASQTPTPEASESPLASETPMASETPAVLESPTPMVAETPRPTPKPVASATPRPASTPKPVALNTPKPADTPTPVAVNTPKPAPTPKPVVEDPPAHSDQPACSVRVTVSPADVDAKVYLVNESDRYSDHSSGSVRLQQVKKGTYTLKIIANGYETFTKKNLEVSKEHKLSVRLERIPPPPEPAYNPPAPGPAYDPGYSAPAPAPYYPPPPAPSGGSYQIPAPGI